MMFNKYFPNRPAPTRTGVSPEARAWLLRGAWYVSLAMLVAGYVLLFLFWDA